MSCRSLTLSLVFILVVSTGLLPALPAAAQNPEVAPGHHEYVIWMLPDDEGGAILPLTLQDRSRYCASAQEFARRIWDVTNGRHEIRQVTFVYDELSPVGGYHARWRRFHDVPYATGVRFYMYDEDKGCTPVWGVGGGAVVRLPNECPDGLTCNNDGDRPRCVDDAFQFVQRTPAEWGWVMAHEAAHAYYQLPDEYLYPVGQPQDFLHICSNPVTDTSLMASRQRDHWCDSDTHLHQRWILGFGSPANGNDVQVTEPSLAGYDVWTDVQNDWMDLQDYVVGEYDDAPAPPFAPAGDLCVWTGALADATPVNDTILVVDKSGSMGFKNSDSVFEPTALEAAFDAALAHYNAVPAGGRNVGLLQFDTAITETVPYAPRTSTLEAGDFSLAHGGFTDLCLAVSEGAARVRTSGAVDPRGAVVLLTDGRPTQAPCNDDESVLTAVVNACLGTPPVDVWPIAFGDADYHLIHQMENACGTEAMWIEKSGLDVQENTHEIKAALLRQGYHVRGYQQVRFDREPTRAVNERSFPVPPGTDELEVLWSGEPFVWTDPDVGSRCAFRDLDFELLDPHGVPQGLDPVPPTAEATYHVRSLRVRRPEPGTWTLRATAPASWFCRADNSQYSGHVPELLSLVQIRNSRVSAEVEISGGVLARNQALEITAVLQTDSRTALTGIDATARVRHDGVVTAVPLRDDGAGRDETAGDGIYTGVFNDCAAPLAPGAYRVLVTVTSDEDAAVPVVSPYYDHALNAGTPTPGPAISATFTEERSVVVRECLDPAEADRCGQPAPPPAQACRPASAEPQFGPLTLEPGGTAPDLEVCVDGVILVARGVRIGLGPGVTADNVRTEYDLVADRTCITFDATADEDAPAGEIGVTVGFGDDVYPPGGTGLPLVVEKSRDPAWSFHVGVAEATGAFSGAFDRGPALALDHEWPLADPWSWRLRLGWASFDATLGPSDLDVFDLSAALRYRLAAGTSWWGLLEAGPGVYHLDPGSWEGGYGLGAGLGFQAAPDLVVEGLLQRRGTFTASPDLELNELTLGLLWSF